MTDGLVKSPIAVVARHPSPVNFLLRETAKQI